MRFANGLKWIVSALIVLGMAIYLTHTGVWRDVSTALGFGNPDAIVDPPVVTAPKTGGAPDVDWDEAKKKAEEAGTSIITQVQQALDDVDVKGKAPKTGYERDAFGPAWSDVDHNGCDTRNDILARDLTGVTFKPGTHDCVVASGVLDDPYTGKTIRFTRGNKTSSAVQIDHVVALSNAWVSGANAWDDAKRLQFANDPVNLLAVDGPANMAKKDGDAATWLPSNKSFRCEYVSRQVEVKTKYGLSMTRAEKRAIDRELDKCAG